ncbi:hypothetical protein JKF63_03593 [Porcisia hertigi]|uniref:Uncharacterized protein n=1 Tax=Porcisia hertigi TaxID=2761500 RepID=A0A836I016_9TRYP|nr:hypothetical protein JKF63_03593 [Porcisia hertigi]
MAALTPKAASPTGQVAPTKTFISPPQQRPCSAGLPPCAVLVKSTLVTPTTSISRQHSTTPTKSPLHSRSASYIASNPTLPLPPPSVPANCWYAKVFAEPPGASMSAFHRDHRGKVIFSPRPVPVEAEELLALPGQCPQTLTICEVGKDLLYGMAYLYAPPLAVEHRWRGRVAHLHRVQKLQTPIPDVVRRGLEGRAALLGHQQANGDSKVASPPSSLLKTSRSPSPALAASAVKLLDYSNVMRFERGEAAVYERPDDKLLIGIKVFVNEEMVENHYPDVHALPQCTATITAKEAAQSWSCVPFVLMGFLNQMLIDPISIFHTLSLNFVEHLLRVKLHGCSNTATSEERVRASSTQSSSLAAANSHRTKAVSLELPLRVEVVYGCRAEAFYCTEFISRGQCLLRMTEASKPSLKSYEEKLRALVKLRHTAPQLIPRPTSGFSPPRACVGCGHLLQYRCTVCGAEVCGELTCAFSAVTGYPRPCRRHALRSQSTN